MNLKILKEKVSNIILDKTRLKYFEFLLKVKNRFPDYWINQDTDIITIYILLFFEIDNKWYTYDCDTIIQYLKRNHKIKETDNTFFLSNKINALRLTFINNFIWEDFLVFEKTAAVFNNTIPNFNRYEKLDPSEIYIAMELLNIINEKTFKEEIWSYTAVSLYENGYILAPGILISAQPKLNKLSYYKQEEIDNIIKNIKSGKLDEISQAQLEKNKKILEIRNNFIEGIIL